MTGGYDQGVSVNSAYVYDPQADAWTQVASMSIARRGHASAVVDGKLYVFGGVSGMEQELSSVEVYDPASDSWARGPSMASACYDLAVVAL